jgi:membrane fusion protein, copper/silver efflux system
VLWPALVRLFGRFETCPLRYITEILMKKIILVITLILTWVSLGIAKEIWYCPMHPSYTSDKPGLCPICNMSLVKKEGNPSAEAASMRQEQQHKGIEGHAAVSLSSIQIQMMGVKTVQVKHEEFIKKIRVPGYVSTMHDLYKYQDDLIKASIDYVTVFRDYKRFSHTRRSWETHRELQLKLHEAEDQLLRLGLRTEDVKKLQESDWKNLWKQPELLLLKENMYWVVAQIFEIDRGFVEVGQEVKIEIPSYNESVKGVIRTIGGIFDSNTRTVNALIELQDFRGELEGNMLVNVDIAVELGKALIVPKTAVMDTGLRKIVYVQTAPGMFEPREIQVVALGDNGWAVKSGLKEGEKVAVEGNFLVDSESRLQSSLQGAMQESGGHNHGN